MGFAENHTRRQFLWAGTAAAGGLLAATALRADGPAERQAANTAEDVSPAEDLMREHGVLRRLLLVYEEVDRRIAGDVASVLGHRQAVKPELLSHATQLIRHFIEDYHEHLEEDHVFPRLVKAGKLVDLTKVLEKQHDAGRRLTNHVLEATEAAVLPTGKAAEPLRENLHRSSACIAPTPTARTRCCCPPCTGS